MKKTVFSVVIFLMTISLFGQRDALDNFFNSYEGRDGYTCVVINGNIFGILKAFDDDPDLDNLDNKITSIRIVSREDEYRNDGSDFDSELRNVVKRGNYEELMRVRKSDENLQFLIRTQGNSVRELLIISSGENEAVIQIRGNLTREDVRKIAENDGDGIARLELLENSGK